MKLIIERVGENIIRVSDLSDPRDKGEIAHFICELEAVKKELQGMWEESEQ